MNFIKIRQHFSPIWMCNQYSNSVLLTFITSLRKTFMTSKVSKYPSLLCFSNQKIIVTFSLSIFWLLYFMTKDLFLLLPVPCFLLLACLWLRITSSVAYFFMIMNHLVCFFVCLWYCTTLSVACLWLCITSSVACLFVIMYHFVCCLFVCDQESLCLLLALATQIWIQRCSLL